ncbi:MAG: hypothetical protein RI897_745 [Verrucomicrobiota bacterium]
MAFAPDGFQHTFGSFDLLQGGGEGVTALGEIGDVTDEEAADASAGEDGLEEEDDRLFVGVPALSEHLPEEIVVEGDEL